MVNSTDFRRYYSSYELTNDIDEFSQTRSNTHVTYNQSRSSAAPKIYPETRRENRKKLRVDRKSNKKPDEVLEYEERTTRKQIIFVSAVVSIVLIALFAMLFSYAQKNELNSDINTLKTELSFAQGENVTLNAKMENLISTSQIDKYAVEKLGMVKMETDQIRYINSEKTKEAQHASTDTAS